jgi:hypothetical protein
VPAPLASLFPGGPLLYVEARDFAGILRSWNTSPEKQLWIASDNRAVFSRSRLFQRLADEQQAFAGAAGFAPNMSLLDTVAGSESALAIYDIGELAFLYITRLPASRLTGTVLASVQSSYESRSASGRPYFVRRAGNKVAAFASVDGLLILGTREDLIASALALVAKQAPVKAVSEDPWFSRAAGAARAQGEIRLVLNMQPLLASTYFRSYWIQRNRSELMPFTAAAVDVFREPNRIREERVLVRTDPAPPTAQQTGAGQLLALVPPAAGLHRVWAAPSVDLALGLIGDKIVAPGRGAARRQLNAPAAADVTSIAGTEADIETPIDQPPLASDATDEIAALRPIVQTAGLDALLEIQTSRRYPDGVFVGNQTALVLLAPAAWPEPAVRSALPARLVHVAGRMLILADRQDILNAVIARIPQPAAPPVYYSALYRHQQEFAPYTQMMRMIDAARGVRVIDPGRSSREPHFFSENLVSLGRVFGKLAAASIVATDTGALMKEQVLYTFVP